MIEQIIIAGSGGQGVLTLGIYLARAAAFEGKNVAWLPAYGAEKRGGPSFCSLIISDTEIFSPVVETPDTLIAFDQRAIENYMGKAGSKNFHNRELIACPRRQGEKHEQAPDTGQRNGKKARRDKGGQHSHRRSVHRFEEDFEGGKRCGRNEGNARRKSREDGGKEPGGFQGRL